MELVLLELDDEYAVVGRVANVVISAWRTEASAARIGTYRRCLDSCVEASPQGIASITHLAPGIKPPDAAAREALVGILRDFDAQLLAYATVMSSEGPTYAGLSALASTLTLLSRGRVPRKFLPTPDEAVAWVLPHLEKTEPRPSAAALEAGMRSVIARLAARPEP